jgi:hypothetical protein
VNIKTNCIFILIIYSLLIIAYASDTSGVVAEYYIDNTSHENYKLLRLSKELKPMPQIFFSEYEKQYLWHEKYWGMKILFPTPNLSFMCNSNSYYTEKRYEVYETELSDLDLNSESKPGKKESVIGLKLRHIENIYLPKNASIEQYINKIVSVQWSIKTDRHGYRKILPNTIDDLEPMVKGSFSIRILDSGKKTEMKDIFSTSACLPSEEEKCGNTELLPLAKSFLKFLPNITNLGNAIFENIPEYCNTVFISEKLYKMLNKTSMKILNDSLNKIGIKLLFADEIYSCIKYNRENLRHSTLTGDCKIEVTNGGMWGDVFIINETRYCINSLGKNDYILDNAPLRDFHSNEPICNSVL